MSHLAPLARSAALLLALAAPLAGCKPDKEAAAPEPRPVRTVIAAPREAGQTVLLTGHIEAVDEAPVAFRIAGRILERKVNVGDRVTAGQELARLDPKDELSALRSAQASLAAARAALVQTSAAFDRQRTLLRQGHTPRAQFDQAEQAMRTAQAQVDDAEAQTQVAANRVSFTVLTADADGVVTARGAEPGEVVQPGQMVVRVARHEGRDAVFDVPAQLIREAPPDPEIAVALADDASVHAVGRVREVAPQADPVTRTFAVRVGLSEVPEAMRLGATVNGRVRLESVPVISLPASALTQSDDKPAVWVVDPAKLTVALRPIELVRHDPGTVVVAHGLATGDIVVTAGIQSLHPGQAVRLVGPAA